VMKMPSTYISLLLFCGLMLFFIYCHNNKSHKVHPVFTRVETGRRLIQNKKSENDFSFFRDIISNIAPALKK